MADPFETVPHIIRGRAQDIDLYGAIVPLCSRCLDGAGGICHTPGCILCRSAGPDIPIREMVDHHTEDGIARLTALLDAERLARQTAEQKLASLSRAPNAYHPDPDINVEVAQEATDGAAFDLAAGIEPGWHRGNAAEEVTRLRRELTEARAMAPRWVLHRYSDTSAAWRLHTGNTIIDKSGIGVWGAESRIADIETADYHPTLESAARAVCARLGLPYIEVPRG